MPENMRRESADVNKAREEYKKKLEDVEREVSHFLLDEKDGWSDQYKEKAKTYTSYISILRNLEREARLDPQAAELQEIRDKHNKVTREINAQRHKFEVLFGKKREKDIGAIFKSSPSSKEAYLKRKSLEKRTSEIDHEMEEIDKEIKQLRDKKKRLMNENQGLRAEDGEIARLRKIEDEDDGLKKMMLRRFVQEAIEIAAIYLMEFGDDANKGDPAYAIGSSNFLEWLCKVKVDEHAMPQCCEDIYSFDRNAPGYFFRNHLGFCMKIMTNDTKKMTGYCGKHCDKEVMVKDKKSMRCEECVSKESNVARSYGGEHCEWEDYLRAQVQSKVFFSLRNLMMHKATKSTRGKNLKDLRFVFQGNTPTGQPNPPDERSTVLRRIVNEIRNKLQKDSECKSYFEGRCTTMWYQDAFPRVQACGAEWHQFSTSGVPKNLCENCVRAPHNN